MAMMAAEVLGIPVRAGAPDRRRHQPRSASLHVTGGSRVTFATGMAVTQAAEKVVDELKKRAAMIWDISPDAVDWKDGKAYPAGPNAGSFEPLSLAEIALKAARTGGPITRRGVDQRAGRRRRLRDAYLRRRGRPRDRPGQDPALHRGPGCRPRDPPQLCRGPDPGRRRRRASAGRSTRNTSTTRTAGSITRASSTTACPVASDLPMIEAVMVEVPNPRHPFGARGVGEVPIVPPMAAVANAIRDAIGLRMRDLPMSPPKVRKALDVANGDD